MIDGLARLGLGLLAHPMLAGGKLDVLDVEFHRTQDIHRRADRFRRRIITGENHNFFGCHLGLRVCLSCEVERKVYRGRSEFVKRLCESGSGLGCRYGARTGKICKAANQSEDLDA